MMISLLWDSMEAPKLIKLARWAIEVTLEQTCAAGRSIWNAMVYHTVRNLLGNIGIYFRQYAQMHPMRCALFCWCYNISLIDSYDIIMNWKTDMFLWNHKTLWKPIKCRMRKDFRFHVMTSSCYRQAFYRSTHLLRLVLTSETTWRWYSCAPSWGN